MKVLVTGANGFLGRRLVRRLLAGGDHVRCFVRPGTDAHEANEAWGVGEAGRAQLFRGTLANEESLAEAAAGCKVVYHAAASLVGGTAVLFLNNVTATRSLMKRSAEAQVRRVVLVSSLGVYGTHHLRAGDVLDESCPLDSRPHLRDPYTFSKIEQEKAAREVHERTDMELVVVRPGVIYGPGRSVISARIGLQLGQWLLRMGGRQLLPYAYVDNLADAIALAGSAMNIDGQAINIVDDELPRASALLKQYRRRVGGLRVVPVPHIAIAPISRMCERYHRWSRGQLPAILTRHKSEAMWKRLRYTNVKAKRMLGWTPAVRFREGIELTLSHGRTADRAA